jgi:hypothetical protein
MVFLLDMSCMFEAREHSEQYKLSVAVYILRIYDLYIFDNFFCCRQLQQPDAGYTSNITIVIKGTFYGKITMILTNICYIIVHLK